MKKCIICQTNPSTCSAIVGGKYYEEVCESCKLANNRVSPGHAEWSRGIDSQDHEADLQQPYSADGSINTKFVKLYPKQAAAVLTPEELEKAMRK
jgi:hypothetical protein